MNRINLSLLGIAALIFVTLMACRVFWHPAPAPAASTSEARELARADRLAKLGNWEAAGPIYTDLEARFRKKADLRDEIYAYVSRFGAEEESIDLQKVSAELAEIIRRPIVQKDLQLKQRCLEIKAHIDLNLDGISARPSLEELQRVAKTRNDIDAASRASGELGILAFLEGNLKEARNRVVSALLNATVHHDTGAQIRYMSLIGQGLAESNKAAEALWSFNQALRLSRNTPEAGFPKLVVSGKASVLTQLGRYPEAHEIINDGLKYARSRGYIGFEVDMLSQSGQLGIAEGKPDNAILLYERAAALARQIRFNRGLAEVSAKLASLYQRAGNLSQAEKAEENSISAQLQMGEVYELPLHLAVKANLQQALGSWEAARKTYLTAEQIVGTMVRNAPTDGVKRSVIAGMSEIYIGHFRLAISQRRFEEAFRAIEDARGRVAADRLRSSEHDRRPSAAVLNAERQVAALQTQLLDTQDERERNRLSDALTEIEQQTPLQDDTESGEKMSERPSLRDLQARLQRNETVLEYVLAEPESYCLIVKPTRVEVVKLQGQKTLEGLAEKHIAAITARAAAISEGRQLHAAILEPLGELIRDSELIIIPDGGLHRIPFAALVDHQNRYLIQTHAIDYSPSGAVLALLRKSVSNSAKELLAVGNVSYDEESRANRPWQFFRGLDTLSRRSLTPLPATRDEVRAVASTMRDLDKVILTGRSATESSFKREVAKRATVIHLAVHAFADKVYPDRSGLVFAAGDQGEDGLLQVREIRRLPLAGTSLVTLSACDTSAGRIEGEEGVSSIVSAFLYAGARTAAASFWAIEDSSTSELMKEFYQQLAQGQSKSTALRAAQLELLRRGNETKSPFFWAAFGLIGDGSGKIEENARNDKRSTQASL